MRRRTAQEIGLALVDASGLPIRDEVRAVAGRFLPEMNEYCEFIQGPGGQPFGMMVRGEEETFTARALDLMRRWDMPERGLEEFQILARRYEHRRSFVKLEWSIHPHTGAVEHLVGFYFRRRPPVTDVLRHLLARGVDPAVLEQVLELALLLDKDTVHFVAAAMRPGSAVHHKLYFSQFAAPDTAAQAAQRLDEAMARFVVDPAARALVRERHEALVPPEREETFFVSLRFDDAALAPGLKVDYHLASPSQVASLVAPEARPAVESEVARLCAALELPQLSYLGVTLRPQGMPALKYYADRGGSSWL